MCEQRNMISSWNFLRNWQTYGTSICESMSFWKYNIDAKNAELRGEKNLEKLVKKLKNLRFLIKFEGFSMKIGGIFAKKYNKE